MGLVKGITGSIGAVVGAVKNVASAIASYIHFSRPDIGPLRMYEQWMPDFMAGLSRGITDNTLDGRGCGGEAFGRDGRADAGSCGRYTAQQQPLWQHCRYLAAGRYDRKPEQRVLHSRQPVPIGTDAGGGDPWPSV